MSSNRKLGIEKWARGEAVQGYSIIGWGTSSKSQRGDLTEKGGEWGSSRYSESLSHPGGMIGLSDLIKFRLYCDSAFALGSCKSDLGNGIS